jgi:transposase
VTAHTAAQRRRFFARWFGWVTHSRLTPVMRLAWLIRRHLPTVLTHHRHRITNAGLEAVNATIQWVKKRARGLRNAKNFNTAISFHCGGLDPDSREAGGNSLIDFSHQSPSNIDRYVV